MEFLLTVHGHNRWLAAAAWAVGIILLLLGNLWADAERVRRSVSWVSGFLFGLLSLQLLLGIGLFVWKWQTTGTIPHYRWEHALIMLLALLGAHLPLRWRHRPTGQWWRRMILLYTLLGLLLYVGVSRLPKGWFG